VCIKHSINRYPMHVRTKNLIRQVNKLSGFPASHPFIGFERDAEFPPLSAQLAKKATIPQEACSLCMSDQVTHKYEVEKMPVLLSNVKYEWPLCSACYALITDKRFRFITRFRGSFFLDPIEFRIDPHLMRIDIIIAFANSDYADLFTSQNKGLIEEKQTFGGY